MSIIYNENERWAERSAKRIMASSRILIYDNKMIASTFRHIIEIIYYYFIIENMACIKSTARALRINTKNASLLFH